MVFYKEFDNAEEMFAEIFAGVEAAKKRATREQNEITYGDYWMRPYFEADLLIFGYIMTEEELYSSPAYEGVDEEEIEWEKNTMRNSYKNGFRFGNAYSVVVPEGELGDTHVSTMIKINKSDFDEAKAANWDPDLIARMDWFQNLVGEFLTADLNDKYPL